MNTAKLLAASTAVVAALLISTASAAAAQAVTLPAACGSDATQFKVSTTRTAAALTPAPGQALLVFIQKEEGEFAGAPLSRLGIDGAWVGAVKGQSFLIVPVTPGTHAICASRQSSTRAEKDNIGTAPLNARAGEVYYFEFTVDRQEIGAAGRADGGTGGSVGTGNTPDMTARRKDTMDTVTFTALTPDAGPRHLQKLPISVATIK